MPIGANNVNESIGENLGRYNSAVKHKLLAELKELLAGGLPDVRLERPNPLWAKIRSRSSFPTLAQTKDRFEQALKTIPYPYEGRQRQSTYEVLVSRNLLQSVLAPMVLEELFNERSAEALLRGLIDLRKPPKQDYGLPFHEEMIKLMTRHMRRVKDALSNAGVPEEWAKEALTGALRQVAKDLRLLYPEYPDTDFPPSSFGKSTVTELVVDVHRIFATALRRRRPREPKALAVHLTAVFCTPPEQCRTNKLNPNPEAIRKLLERQSGGKKRRDNS